jgi:hypothetical protein
MGHMVRTILELVALMAGFLDRVPDVRFAINSGSRFLQ